MKIGRTKRNAIREVDRSVIIKQLTVYDVRRKTNVILGILNKHNAEIYEFTYNVVTNDPIRIDVRLYMRCLADEWAYIEDDLENQAFVRETKSEYVTTEAKVLFA